MQAGSLNSERAQPVHNNSYNISWWEQPRVGSERESVRRIPGGGGGAEETKSSHFLSPHLGSCVSFRLPLAIDFSRYPLNGGLVSRLVRFSLLWEMDASSSQWLSQFQVYPYPLKQLSRADISFGSRYRARADKIAQTLVCSQNKSVNPLSLLGDLCPIIGKKSLHSWIKKTFFQTKKYLCAVLKCWKCFVIISYNVEHRHTVLSASWRDLNNSCKNRSPLRLLWGCWWWITIKTMKKQLSTLFIYTGLQKSITVSYTD